MGISPPPTGCDRLHLAVILLALGVTVLLMEQTLPYARLEVGARGGAASAGLASFMQILALASFRDRTMFALSQAGRIQKFVDALVWLAYPLYLAARHLPVEPPPWVSPPASQKNEVSVRYEGFRVPITNPPAAEGGGARLRREKPLEATSRLSSVGAGGAIGTHLVPQLRERGHARWLGLCGRGASHVRPRIVLSFGRVGVERIVLALEEFLGDEVLPLPRRPLSAPASVFSQTVERYRLQEAERHRLQEAERHRRGPAHG